MMKHNKVLLMILVIYLISILSLQVEAKCSPLPLSEVEALQQIGKELGKKDWNFNEDPHGKEASWFSQADFSNNVSCICSDSDQTYHVTTIILQGQDLPGILSPSIAKLPYLTMLDLNWNYLSGNIPHEWISTKLEHLSVSVNNLPAGPIPSYLGNITTLTYLSLETNRFSGTVPPELGNLVKLKTLVLSANNLTGELPMTLTNLTKLIDLQVFATHCYGG